MHIRIRILGFVAFALIVTSCSSPRKINDAPVTAFEAQTWLKENCAPALPALQEVRGEMVLRANTQEFKGQFPASIRVEKDGKFTLEVTNIVGGTIAQITGNSSNMNTKFSSKPKYDRAGVEYYMGIPARTLVQLIRGDLPCPVEGERKKVLAEGANMVIDTGTQRWAFKSVHSEKGELPGRIRIEPQKIDLEIEEWDSSGKFARKVSVKSEAGSLKWFWKSRELK